MRDVNPRRINQTATWRANKSTPPSVLLLILVALSHVSDALSSVNASEPQPVIDYDAHYLADYNGMKIKVHHKLGAVGIHQYREILSAENMLGSIREEALFDVGDDNRIIPREYRYQTKLIGIKRSESQVFDWSNYMVEYRNKGGEIQQIGIKPGHLDMMSHKLQLRRDLKSGIDPLSYTVVSGNQPKQYDYQILSHPVLHTAIGPLNTVLIAHKADPGKTPTKIWLATDWDYLVVRFEKTEEGEVDTLNLVNAQVDNKTVVALEAVMEE